MSMTIYELGGSLEELLSTLKRNREGVGVQTLKTKYQHPYRALLNQIEQTASSFVSSVALRGLVLNPDVPLQEQLDVITKTIDDSGLLIEMGRDISRHYDVSRLHSLALKMRKQIELALWPYINLKTCLVADLSDLEKEPVIYNTLTEEIYEHNTWVTHPLSLQGKLLVYLKPNAEDETAGSTPEKERKNYDITRTN
ncbi:hypothetical protein [Clostridium sp. C105KSO13]|uniref:hypothetical protein n=1 Tax=Clostridium sp. C105KSO13 TaxID=1776045 RepID=UPI0007406793|nr:hypothetical protein BN3456_00813 [Clostridium sp. C105KSO13]